MNRRNFLNSAGILTMAGLVNTNQLFAQSGLIDKVGLGLFSIPSMLDKNFKGAFEMLANIGFTEIEPFGPFPFSTEKARNSWEAITPNLGFKGSGYFGKQPAEFLSIVKANGMNIPALHTDFDTLQTKMGPLAEAANQLGAKYVVLPSIPPENRKNLDDYKRTAALFNKIGEEAKKYGIRYGYHNHGYGLQLSNGKMPLDIIFDETDASLVYFEMDLYWTMAGGANPNDLFKKHPGRYKMMHVKDMKEKKRFAGDGGDPSQWISMFPYMTSAGEGVFDLPTILKTAKQNGVDHFFVEQDRVENPAIALKKSFDYLKTL
jgi:sugar phosphate isomerase/epimerase